MTSCLLSFDFLRQSIIVQCRITSQGVASDILVMKFFLVLVLVSFLAIVIILFSFSFYLVFL